MNKEIKTDLTAEESFDSRESVTQVRNSENRINEYKVKVFVREKPTFGTTLSREDVEKIYSLYSSEGADLTQRTISREFPAYTFEEFKKILRAFNITKACSPIAPHLIEERDSSDLVNLALQIKENCFLKKLEQEKVKNLEKQLKETSKKFYALKSNTDAIVKAVEDNTPRRVYTPRASVISNKSLILHISDMHIGAKVSRETLFSNPYNPDVVISRLKSVLDKLADKKFDTVVINLLGDNIDGINQTTARPSSTHLLPQNLDNYEQVKAFLEIMEWFVSSLVEMKICNKIKMYSVKCGNHDGIVSWIATTALFAKLKLLYPNIESKIFDEFFGYYEQDGHKWIITHGKDDLFMKHGLGLNIKPNEKIQIYNWLESKGIYGTNIHVIKGDLHSDNLNSCKKMDYRNCLSLFGASDHSNFNYELNDYGVSYEVIDNGELMRGTFINL